MFVPRTIAALASHTDLDATRYALGGVRFERDSEGKPHAIATDGRRLIHATWSENPDSVIANVDSAPVNGFETIIPTKAVQSIAKAAKSTAGVMARFPGLGQFAIEESTANGSVNLAAANLETTARETVQSVDGRFPKWRDVFPKYGTLPQSVHVALANRKLTAEELAVRLSAESFVADVESKRRADGSGALTDSERKQFYAEGEQFAEEHPFETMRAAFRTLRDYVRDGSAVITLDPSYVIDACKAVRELATSDDSRGVDFTVPLDPGRAVTIGAKSPAGTDVTVVIMPLARDR